MKIGVRLGHMLEGPDTGAVGYISETYGNRLYGAYVIKYLQQEGNEVVDCTPQSATSLSDSLEQGVNKANDSACQLFVSLHLNSGGGTGTEVIYYPGSAMGMECAKKIADSISQKCGYYNRGAKEDTRGLYELKYTGMPAVIVEPFFVDNKDDCQKFDPQKLGKAICEGIVGYNIVDASKPEKTVDKAIDILVNNGIILTKEYWLKAVGVVKYLDKLIIDMANKLISGNNVSAN